MTPFINAGAGFLLAVLWFDLMFDVQVLRHREAEVTDVVLDSISAYYARVTTAATPMNRLVAAVMAATLGCLVAQVARGDAPAAAVWGSLALVLSAVALAAGRTVPAAVRLGTRADDRQRQRRLARAILRDHLLCLAAIGGALALQLAFVR